MNSTNDKADDLLHAVSATRISTELYGSHIMSSFKIFKGFTMPKDQTSSPQLIHSELLCARDEFQPKEELVHIL